MSLGLYISELLRQCPSIGLLMDKLDNVHLGLESSDRQCLVSWKGGFREGKAYRGKCCAPLPPHTHTHTRVIVQGEPSFLECPHHSHITLQLKMAACCFCHSRTMHLETPSSRSAAQSAYSSTRCLKDAAKERYTSPVVWIQVASHILLPHFLIG